MVKNWKKFIESNIFGKSKQDIEDEFNQKLSFSKNYASAMQRQKNAEIREINLKKYEYTKEEINLVSRIKSKSKEIEKEYEFELDFKRFDDLGIPFIDIIEKNAHNGLGFAVYDIKHKRFSIWQTYKCKDISDLFGDTIWRTTTISSNMEIDYGYLYIKGDFFEQINRLYYIYYE